ncbi:MAG TPA: tRNA pseudouridine(38-40) synthase TruA [Proteobacteria bacterium]|nr:tRNA pseudouridine(38-40) synthase TruA [Pseudomonadota bacterium]
MRRIKLTLEYDGTGYAGWQVQPKSDTIQRRVEEALAKVLQEKVRIHGSGRTDAGVHARGQVAHFDTGSNLPLKNIRDGANTYLPPDIAIIRIEEAAPDFHARYSARGKIYLYRVLLRETRSPLSRNYTYRLSLPVDIENIRIAARNLIGRHDFSAFEASGSSIKDKVRQLSRLEIRKEGENLEFEFQGNGFLYKMVRNIVGTLIEVGKGNISPEEVKDILGSKDRTRAGPTAPAAGLCLIQVLY